MGTLLIAGTLTSAVQIVIPSVQKAYFVRNQTSGSFSVTLKTAGGSGNVIPQGGAKAVWCDSVSVFDTVDGTGIGALTSVSPTAFTSVVGITAAASVSLGNATYATVSGATTIVNLGLGTSGTTAHVKFQTALRIVQTSAVIDLPNNANNLDVTAGDTVIFTNAGTSAWVATGMRRASGLPTRVGRQSIWLPGYSILARASAGFGTSTVDYSQGATFKYATFDAATTEYGGWYIAMPPSWDRSVLAIETHWSGVTTGAIALGYQAFCVNDNELLSTAFGTGVTVTDTFQTTAAEHKTSEITITAGGSVGTRSLLYVRMFRSVGNAGDTMALDMNHIGTMLYYNTSAADDA